MIGQCYSKNNKKYNIIILAGGAGSRMGEASDYIPKALSKLGELRAIDYIIQRYMNVAHKFVIGTGYHADLLMSYVKGNYSKFDLEFSYEKPEEMKNNGISTVYCLDHCDCRYPTVLLFCDLMPLSNFIIEDDSFLVATEKTFGNIGTFRHTIQDSIITEMKEPVRVSDGFNGVMGNFVFSDTVLLKELAYANYGNMKDLTNDVVMNYTNIKILKGINCEKCFEFGNDVDIKKVREVWEQ